MIEPGQVAAVRKRLGWSQSELARRSGVSQSLIAKIEAGLLDPSYSRLRALSDVLERNDGGPLLTAERVMCRNVVVMYATEPLELAIEHLAKHGISQLPVFDEGVLVGTVTESSVLHYLGAHRHESDTMKRPVRAVMTQAMPQVPPETPADSLLPLLDVFPGVLVAANGRIQGIVTKSDLLRGGPPRRDGS